MLEGSLVIGINPHHVGVSHQKPDELEVQSGKCYVIIRMFADMWALCAEVSNKNFNSCKYTLPLGYVPLFAVTLARNFSSFLNGPRDTAATNNCILAMSRLLYILDEPTASRVAASGPSHKPFQRPQDASGYI